MLNSRNLKGNFTLHFRPFSKALVSFTLAGLSFYRLLISPFFGRGCRYLPTCSAYASEAIDKFGVVKGTGKSLLRISKCHPWGGNGYDPVIKFEKRKKI